MSEFEKNNNIDRLVNELKELRLNNNASEGLSMATQFALGLGGEVRDNPEGGIIISLDGATIHVWQLYSDIDKIYFEY